MTFILTIIVLLACGCARKEEYIPGAGPVDHFKKSAHWIYVYPRSDVSSDVLYSARLLASFKPGHPLSEAVLLYGKPKTETPEDRGARYLIYETENGLIKLGSETTADNYTSFPLYFIPHDRRASAFFCAEIVKQIDTRAPKQVVMLIESGYKQPFLHALIEYGQIQDVILINREVIE
jgi:hypothetical protein